MLKFGGAVRTISGWQLVSVLTELAVKVVVLPFATTVAGRKRGRDGRGMLAGGWSNGEGEGEEGWSEEEGEEGGGDGRPIVWPDEE